MTMILPGSTIGILGGGQLARMTALAARRLGYRLAVFEHPDADAPAAPVCERAVRASFDDADALAEFARGVDVVTLEFENIPTEALRALAAGAPVRPHWQVLGVCQHREREKLFLRKGGYPHAEFRVVTSVDELRIAVADLGLPCVLKTAEFGYDGKGQLKIDAASDLDAAWRQWAGGTGTGGAVAARRGVLEAWVPFRAELSVICARNPGGETVAFPVVENIHTRHILDFSIAPGRFPPEVAARAMELARAITEALGVVGLLAVEMFLTEAGEIVVNELAPRPHNSGHLTLDAGMTSQFEQHARAVCGLPLGKPDLLCPAVMVNLLGDLWPAAPQSGASSHGRSAAPDWLPVLTEPDAKLHLYGKTTARPGRKMGHFCVLAPTVDEALARARRIKQRLEDAAPAERSGD